ncbi:hypothetical protein BCR32DRAFT_287087 [Anaeromyces robustus]|uniref:Uncharacterized protein n=1 Tax=Anaeromyces robustus TaxID=1754192 RepID=A0A1Y1VUM4_9FUNG|nr:hypothetical protein BCR32DRAFT_287087 [Anaeromyces robustus]|eukprot:ORX64454.1 hypothetical protein BCR32DRAFT_287087 [Anaeromyces robustus]
MNFKTFFSVAILTLTAVSAIPINDIANIKEGCESYNGKLLTNERTNEYTCLRKIYVDILESNKACYLINNNYTCIEDNFNNVPYCSMGDEAYDYIKCAYSILEMIDDGSNKLNYIIRKFPSNEKIFDSYKIDQKECRGRNGLVLSYKTIQQYICLEPATPKNAKCLKTRNVYCVVQDNTRIETCVSNSINYDHKACIRILKEYGLANNHVITELLVN